ncbi:MAG: hypothetical protein AAGC54_12750 [Cyanobacteria bacterium P01_F01_bin.4]
MILSRRKAHLVYFVVLAILLPILFVAGIVFRPVYGPSGVDAEALFSQSGHGVFARQHELNTIEQNQISAFLQR